jgi:hypothetical protein
MENKARIKTTITIENNEVHVMVVNYDTKQRDDVRLSAGGYTDPCVVLSHVHVRKVIRNTFNKVAGTNHSDDYITEFSSLYLNCRVHVLSYGQGTFLGRLGMTPAYKYRVKFDSGNTMDFSQQKLSELLY